MSNVPAVDLKLLTNEQKEYAAIVLNETIENRDKKIEEIREWLLNNKELCARTDDNFILIFLRGCKFKVEKVKLKLRNFHHQRAVMTEWFSNRNPILPELTELFDLGVFLPLRKLDDEGRLVVIIKASVHDPRKHKFSDVIKAGMMILDVATRDDVSVSLHGIAAILDLKSVTLSHALQLTPNVIKQLVHSWQSCYPFRIGYLYFINAPIYVNVVLNVFKSFMNEKLRKRIHIHRKGIAEKISPNILPIEYGGNEGSISNLKDHWKKVAEENADWFSENEKYKLLI
ncbi:retinol-binding protein pinta-like [Leptopilina heterotoma]|uniref:retinol-binding protein pinta-like n=1 Tax=Leptopilina heterotoma TaxID=63436 RepID=UPI001CA9B6E3|nr:retinol-binding protein pinta-like [Leptopilina heterotoma]XP_043467264.1 retinol-binding protein pinta-like [Leptopilina heterotoma]